MEFRILGPVEVLKDGRPIDLGGPLEKALLARLLLDEGRVVSLDRLIDDIWEGDAPGSANVSIRVRISRLRKALAAAGSASTINTKQPGYLLELDPEDVFDAALFESLRTSGMGAMRSGDNVAAIRDLEASLDVWRGPALSGIGEPPFAVAERSRLDEDRLGATEDLIEAALSTGQHGHIAQLETLVGQYPLRERLWGLRMTALYRSGRQADALAAFQQLRTVLNDELGLEPSKELVELQNKILNQAPDLAYRPPSSPSPERTRSLPSGVVTFLLTDIEGSSELWEAHLAGMAEVLERHDQLINGIVAESRGHLIKSKGEGDATLSVFRRATDAVSAAVEIQSALLSESWRDGIMPSVRMAIHTGEAHERDGDYFGPSVNRAARVRALAAGGHILLSHVAAELVRDSLPDDANLIDLGEKALRGMARAEHVFRLETEKEVEAAAAPAGPISKPPLPEVIATTLPGLFIGRELELDRLSSLLKGAAAGELRTVFAAGEPGIGKTRLCSEFARRCYEDGAVVLYGRSDEEPLVPYQPFVEALRRWAAALSPRDLQGIAGADYLAPLVPELGDNSRPSPAEDPEVSRYRFFEAVASALQRAASAGVVLLILDDLHWADRPTLQLLQHVMRTRGGSPMMILGTYRETDLSRTRPLAEALADFRRERAFERIALSGLAEEEILELLEQSAQHDVGGAGRALAKALSETTEGNPFFIEQIMGSLIDTGRLELREGRWILDAKVEDLGIPEGVIEAIGRRLSRLSDDCNKTLAAASVLGRDFEVDVLTKVLNSDPDEVLATIEEALRVGLIREVPGRGQSSCTFSHALVQQALYGELSLARKQRLHLKAAESIEVARAGSIDSYVTPMARHLREAGAAADPAKAIDYSVRAMDAAARVSAFDEGIAHGEAALELMEEQDESGQPRARLHERLGDMRYVAGLAYERSFAHYEKALTGYERLKEIPRVARVHIKMGRGMATYPQVADITKALEHLHTAKDLLGASVDPRLAGPLALGLAAASIWWADPDEGLPHAERAMQIGEEQGIESIWATGAAFAAWALSMKGQFKQSSELHERSWVIGDRMDNVLVTFGSAWTRCNEYHRDPKDHSRLALIEIEKSRQAQSTNTLEHLRSTASGALAYMGEMRRAREILEGTPELVTGPGRKFFADSWEDFGEEMKGPIATLESRGLRWSQIGWAVYGSGNIAWSSNALDEARSIFQEALALSGSKCPVEEFEARTHLSLVEASQGNLSKAQEHLTLADELATKGTDWRGLLGTSTLARAWLTASEGELARAEDLFVEAVDIYGNNHLPFSQAETFQLWGRALAKTDPHRALEKYDTALDIYVTREVGKAWSNATRAERATVSS